MYCNRRVVSVLFAGGLLLSQSCAWADTPVDKKAEPVAPRAGETVERYAERLLKLRLLKQTQEAAPKPVSTVVADPPAKLENVGEVGPARFELVFIAGAKGQERAHLRIDGQYAKLVKVGEHIAGWHLVGIGGDFVDIAKDGETSRLYLFSQATPQGADPRDRRSPGGNRGS